VQMHNSAPMAFNPATGLIYVPIAASGSFSFTAAETYTATPGAQNFGLNLGRGRGAGTAPALATPPAYGPVRQGARGILSAWDPATQTERWFAPGGGNVDGGALSTAANLVFQVVPNGRLVAYSADKGEKLLDIPTGQTTGMSAPITYMLDGKQYIALMGGNGGPAGGRGRGGPPAAGQQEVTAGAAQVNAPQEPPPNNNPKLFVFTLNPGKSANF